MNASPHLTNDLIERWRGRRLAPEEILSVSDHVVRCPECAAALATNRPPDEVAGAVDRLLEPDRGELTHLDAEQLERWVDGAADPVEHELVVSHLAICEFCRAEAEELKLFAATMKRPAADRRYLPWLAAAAVAAVAAGLAYLLGTPSPPPSAPPSEVAMRPPAPTVQAQPVTRLRDGASTITVHEDGSVEGVPEAWREAVAAVLRRPELTVPAAVLAVARMAEVQRSETEPRRGDVRLVAPLSRIVPDARPAFRWEGQPGAEYRVEVYDSRFALVAASEPATATSWTPPRSLPRGELLTWKLTARRAGLETTYPVPPAPPAVFEVLRADEARDLEAARSSGSHLVSGLALWRAGLVDEAAAEFAAWAAQNPESAAAKALAASSAQGAAL